MTEATSRRWRKLKRRLFPRGLSFTREGKVYVFVALGVGFGAINTGNNLLFLVFGLMLGLIIVSGILSEVTLRRLEVTRVAPRLAEARAPFPVELALVNSKRFAASFGVELKDEIDGRPFRRRCFFLRVGPNEERSIAYRCELERRGRRGFDGTIVSTRFPFGLFEKRRFVALAGQVIALPARVPVSLPRAFAPLGEGARPSLRLGQSQEFRELRPLVEGDDPRRIDWRATARLGQTMVRTTDAEARAVVELVLDAAPDGEGQAGVDRAEHNISLAASAVRVLIERGLTVRLVTHGAPGLEAQDPASSARLLEHLALLDIEAAAAAMGPTGRSAFAIVIGPRAAAAEGCHRLGGPP